MSTNSFGILGIAVRSSSILIGFITIPIVLHITGTENYGVFVSLAGAALFLQALDLGVGNSLMNSSTPANGPFSATEDNESIRVLLRSYMVGPLTPIILGICATPYLLLHESKSLFEITFAQPNWVFGIVIGGAITGIIFNINLRFLFARGESKRAFLWIFIYGFIQSLALVAASLAQEVSSMLIGFLIVPNIILPFMTGVPLRRVISTINKNLIDRFEIRKLIKKTFSFQLLQLGGIATVNLAPTLYLTSFDSAQAASIAAAWKITLVPISLAVFFFFPRWKHYRDLVLLDRKESVLQEVLEVNAILYKSAPLFALLFTFTCPIFLEIWSSGILVVSTKEAFLLSLVAFLYILNQPVTLALYSLELQKILILINSIYCLVIVTTITWSVRFTEPIILFIAIALSQCFVVHLPSIVKLKRDCLR